MICLNCGNNFKGNFCPHCGQKAATRRLCFAEMLKNLIGPFVGGDNKFANTLRDLLLRPGYLTRNYLLGKRIRYYHPLQMFVYVLTTYAVISFVFGISSSIFDEMMDLNMDDVEIEYASIEYVLQIMTKIYSNKLYGAIAMALFAVPCFRWVFRRYKIARPDGQLLPLNHSEQFYAQIYHSCIGISVSIIMLPFCFIDGADKVLGEIFKLLSFVYLIVQYKQLVGISWWKSVLLSLLSVFLSFLFFMVFLFLVCFVAGAIDELSK